jgi:hypothetical protein
MPRLRYSTVTADVGIANMHESIVKARGADYAKIPIPCQVVGLECSPVAVRKTVNVRIQMTRSLELSVSLL